MYKSVDVWERVSPDNLVRYRCFQNLSTGLFCVQSVDFYSFPIKPATAAFLEENFLELLNEQAPDERNTAYPTLVEAIHAHNELFGPVIAGVRMGD